MASDMSRRSMITSLRRCHCSSHSRRGVAESPTEQAMEMKHIAKTRHKSNINDCEVEVTPVGQH